MVVIDGKLVANKIQMEIQNELRMYNSDSTPCIAIVMVGDNIESQTYIRLKIKKCIEMGFTYVLRQLQTTISADELISEIRTLNNNSSVHGILIQLPLPKHIPRSVLNEITLEKDVDGFHVNNMGKLALNDSPLFVPCTPAGIMELFEYYNLDLTGKLTVIVGTSNIVGLPLSLMMLRKKATVIMAHSKTENLQELISHADIVVAACGVPEMIKADWVKENCFIVDVGINKIDDQSKKRGYRLVGDVDYTNLVDIPGVSVNKLTVGPITIMMLLKNTFESFKRTTTLKRIYNCKEISDIILLKQNYSIYM
jgi:5,10-methylene-tetrahydrofolate dehydrogenase/methenyl tetrahydrofolate cyclohydrolase